MKEKNPSQRGPQGGRNPQQPKTGGRAAGPKKGPVNRGKEQPKFADRQAGQGKGGFTPGRGRPAWKTEKPGEGERQPGRGAAPFRKSTGRRADQGAEKRYGRPGSRDTYEPRYAPAKAEAGYQSPGARRFGPGSKKVFTPSWGRRVPQEAARPVEAVVQVPEETVETNLLTGRNPIREALKTGRDLEKLMVAKGDISGSARQIVSMAKDAGVLVQFVERSRLDQLAKNHQGMVAYASAYQYAEMDDIFEAAKTAGEPPFIVILDQITDPHNLGAIIRTAACAGAHGVIVPMHRAVGLTPSAVKASAGAVEHMKVVRVGNLNRTIESLKRQGVWVYAADQDGEDYRKANITGPCALVIGSEGEGISPHTLSLCDHRLKIPMAGAIGSLNASVAAGVLMYAVYNGRHHVESGK